MSEFMSDGMSEHISDRMPTNVKNTFQISSRTNKMSEYKVVCRTTGQIECEINCQIEFQVKMPGRMSNIMLDKV